MNISDLRFLAVEDHEFQRDMLLRMLQTLGAQTINGAPDGHAALDIIKASDPPIDIIISDLDMPGMDGMEFMRHLGASRAPVSIILASALEGSLLASIETMTMAYGVTILGVIEKPITPAKLEALIGLHRPPQATPGPATGLAAPKAAYALQDIIQGLQLGQFEPFFQPKVGLADGRIKGAEALARWRHPSDGIVAPYAFIQILEDCDMIGVLGESMLRQSAVFCRDWRAASGLEVSVSVNLSGKSLTDATLAERLTELVRAEHIEPSHLVLELTESAATTNVGQALENLSRLRMKGFGLSIDDYGTGYSSMQQLTRIAFTELKIDQSFVANAERQQSARIILQSSLEMARRLNITSVAEGVETQEDWDTLRELGCELAQGYFVARPMPGAALLDWSAAWSRDAMRQN